MGFHVTENEMWNISKNEYQPCNWTGKLFTEVIFAKPEYENHPLLQKYRTKEGSANAYEEAFLEDFYAEGAPCYVKTNYMDVTQAIHIIHNNKGKAVVTLPEYDEGKENNTKELYQFGAGADYIAGIGFHSV